MNLEGVVCASCLEAVLCLGDVIHAGNHPLMIYGNAPSCYSGSFALGTETTKVVPSWGGVSQRNHLLPCGVGWYVYLMSGLYNINVKISSKSLRIAQIRRDCLQVFTKVARLLLYILCLPILSHRWSLNWSLLVLQKYYTVVVVGCRMKLASSTYSLILTVNWITESIRWRFWLAISYSWWF